MKKAFSCALALLMMISVISLFSSCGEKESTGFEFKSNGDGTCTLIGLGTCTDTEIVIPKKNGEEVVTVIGKDAFEFNKTVTKVTLPKTITTIEDQAFYNAKVLSEIVLNEGLKAIGNDAFYKCPLIKVKFPKTLEVIGERGFECCDKIEEVILPEGLRELGKSAFADCFAVKKISIPSTVETLYFDSNKNMVDKATYGGTFEVEKLEEIELKGEWKHFKLAMAIDGAGESIVYSFGGMLTRDANETDSEYVKSYSEITEENMQSVICALFNKRSLTVNGKEYKMTTEKPLGKYHIDGMWGWTKQEFTEDGKLSLSYIGASEVQNIDNVLTANYTYDDSAAMYNFQGSTTYEGIKVEAEKYFIFFGDFIFSVDTIVLNEGEPDIHISEWTKE